MRYKEFGKTGMKVSEMALGTWGMGGAGWDRYEEDVKVDAILAAIENGVNLIDTAPAYNAGEAERLVGRALKEAGLREKVFISTKCSNEFIGAQKRDKVEQNAAAFSWSLDEEEIGLLDQAASKVRAGGEA